MKFRKIVETSVYSSNLEKMKEFYVDKLGLEIVSEQKGRHVFLKTDKNMLLIFNHLVTVSEKETSHGASTPPSMVHVAFEIEPSEYEQAKDLLDKNNIPIEKETAWKNDIKSRSIYFRDPGCLCSARYSAKPPTTITNTVRISGIMTLMFTCRNLLNCAVFINILPFLQINKDLLSHLIAARDALQFHGLVERREISSAKGSELYCIIGQPSSMSDPGFKLNNPG